MAMHHQPPPSASDILYIYQCDEVRCQLLRELFAVLRYATNLSSIFAL
jgi:hypothetical protein